MLTSGMSRIAVVQYMVLCLLMVSFQTACADPQEDSSKEPVVVESSGRMPIVLTDLTFDSIVNSTSDWMINLHSPWCPACQEMKPVWERLAHKAQGEYQVGTINVQEEKILLTRFQVTVLPTVFFISRDSKVYGDKGALSVNSMHRFATKYASRGGGGTRIAHDLTPWLEGCSSPVSRCGRILGRIVTGPTWIKKTFTSMRSDFKYGDVALIGLLLGGPVVVGLLCICLLDAYVVRSIGIHTRSHRD